MFTFLNAFVGLSLLLAFSLQTVAAQQASFTLAQHEFSLTEAAFDGYDGVVSSLISQGADINTVDRYGATPLMYAASQGHTAIVSTLIQAGSDLNARDEFHGWSALMFAAFEGNNAAIETLVEAGVDLDLAGAQDGWTPLMLAAHRGHLETVELLIKAGADVNAQNDYGANALSCAERKGHTKIKKKLRRAGAIQLAS